MNEHVIPLLQNIQDTFDAASADTKPYYRVEKSPTHSTCECANCTMWTIVYTDLIGEAPEDVEIGTSWQGDAGKEAAEDVCDLMNMAFEQALEMSK